MRRRRSIVLVLLCLLGIPASARLSFIEPAPAPLVASVVSLATADFNGDGKPDLAVVVAGKVVVMLGNGDGSFQAPTTIYTLPAGLFAGAILAKDLDGDGGIDLAVSVSASHQILWFKGHGDGTFDAPLSTSTNHGAHGLQAADLNHDGIVDLVALNSQEGSLSVFLGVGDGTFQAPADYPVGTNPLDLAIGELDGINGPDLVVGNYDAATVGVLLNHGDGTFGPMVSFNSNMKPQGLYLADFDGDGKLDVVAGGDNCNGGNVDSTGCMVFMKGSGNGSFAAPADANFTGLDSGPSRRHQVENVAPDLNGDGRPDVLFVLSGVLGNSQVMVGLSNGDGTFSVSYWVGAPPQPLAVATPDFVTGIAAIAGDFDMDGVIDLAFATQGQTVAPQAQTNTLGGVSILFGATPGTFDVPRSYHANYKGFTNGLPRSGGVFGDFTGNGKIDLVVLDARTDSLVPSPMLVTFRGNGDGSFQDAITSLPWDPGHSGFSSTLRAADLDRNGTLDLVFFGPQSGIVASGYGDGTFTNFSSFGYAAGGPANMVIADFNGDGYPDLAIFEFGACVSDTRAKNIEILLQGAGGTKTFASKSVVPVNGSCAGSTAMVAADFDKDGKIDLVVTRGNNADESDVLFFKGNGDGTFAKPKVVGTHLSGLPGIVDYTAADLRKNGNLDLIGLSLGYIVVQLGNGNGTFQARAAYGAGGFPVSVKAADFDGDGIPDIAVALLPFSVLGPVVPGSFAVLRGKGDGTFEPPVKLAIGVPDAGWLDVADVNADGLPDVVVGHAGVNGNAYTVLINDSTSPVVDLAISKSDLPDPVGVGAPLSYTIKVTNHGPDGATGVTLTDPLPATVTFVSATPSQGNCTGTATITCSLGSLSTGSSATVTIAVTPTQVGGISNTATVTANESDPDTSNNSATQVTTINGVDRQLTALSPVKLWVGQNGNDRHLKYDLEAEVFVNGITVATGQLSNVNAGAKTFALAIRDAITPALSAPTPVPAGASLSIRVSVRASCATPSKGVFATARLWYNSQAGSGFGATIGATASNYFLRPAFVLATTAGNAKQSIDVAVNDQSTCPARPFVPFGTWTVNVR